MSNDRKKTKHIFYLFSLFMFVISLLMIFKTLRSVDYIYKTLAQREATVLKLHELYSELQPFLVVKEQLLNEFKKRHILDIDTILYNLDIPYIINEEESIDREGLSFVTQSVTVNDVQLSDIKTLLDNFMHEWPYINVQRVQIFSIGSGRANLKIKFVLLKIP